jgi:hypothetical protein
MLLVVGIQVPAQESFHSFRTSNFEIKYQPRISEKDARKVSDYLEQDYAYLSNVLRMNFGNLPEVRIYDSEQKFMRASNEKKGSRGARFRRAILHVKPVSEFGDGNKLAVALSMELPVIMLEQAIRLGCPQWLAQSFAVYHAGVMPDLSPPTGRKFRYFSDLDENIQEFPDPPQREDVEFVLGTTMKFFVETFGEEKSFRVFGKFDGATATEEIFRSYLGKEYDVTETAWAAYVSRAVPALRQGGKTE